MPPTPIKRITKAIDPNDPRIQQMKDMMGRAAERERQLVGSRPGFVNELSDEETAQTVTYMDELAAADSNDPAVLSATAEALDQAGIDSHAIAPTTSDLSAVRSSNSRPTGTIIAPPTPCRMRAAGVVF